MSLQDTYVGFSLHDLLTRIIPGSVVIGPGVLSWFISSPEVFQNTGAFLLLFGLSSLLAGEAIEILRASGFRVPLPFLQMVYRVTGDEEKLSFTQQKILAFEKSLDPYLPSYFRTSEPAHLENRLDLNFRNSIESELQVDFERHSPRDVYDFLILRLEGDMSPQTKRYRSLSIFTSNLRIASVVASFIYVLFFVINFFTGSDTPELAFAALTSVLILGYAWPITQIFANASNLYVESLLKEYYAQVHSNK